MENNGKTLLFFTFVTGFIAGTIAVLYRLLLEFAENSLLYILALPIDRTLLIVLWFGTLAVVAWIISVVIRWNPSLSGGGLAQMMNKYRHSLPGHWWKNIIGNFIGCTLSLFSGLSIGQTSPVIQVGASTANGISALCKSAKPFAKTLLLLGASAGFSAAFSAPFSGSIFGLTEVKKKFDLTILLLSMIASGIAYLLLLFTYGFQPLFHMDAPSPFSVKFFFLLIIFSILLAFFGILYNVAIVRMQYFFDKLTFIPTYLQLLPVFAISGILAFTVPQVLGSGMFALADILSDKETVSFLLLLLVLKTGFSILSPTCGVPGGMIFPILIIGALAGKLFAELAGATGMLAPEHMNSFIIFGMAGSFVATIRDPIVAPLLLLETTWQLHCLPGLILVSAITFLIPTLFKSEPVYEALATRIYNRFLASVPATTARTEK